MIRLPLPRLAAALACAVLLATAPAPAGAQQQPATSRELRTGSFAFDYELTLPGTPEAVFDALTGDVSPWWDHSFSRTPKRLYIEPRPGGGFYEIFDDAGNGARHAEVILADRGKLLRFDGPLGLSGSAVKMVHTFEFQPVGADSTRLKLRVHATGEVDESWPTVVPRVWHHFLFERFKPYVEGGRRPLPRS